MRIGQASIDERKKISGGKAGNQSGSELNIRAYYDKNWQYVLRPISADVAEKSAAACEAMCANKHIGYDQGQRNDLIKDLEELSWDYTKLTKDTECDCSSFMTACALCAGVKIAYAGNAPTTSTMVSRFKASGAYQIEPFVSQKHNRLRRGDILDKPGAHTVMVLDNYEEQKSISEIAAEVIAGKWGNGADRIAKLKAAGYDPKAVQTKVNELCTQKKASDRPATMKADAAAVWAYLLDKIGNPYGAAGFMGNLYAESGLLSINLQNSFEKKSGYTDQSYTDAVDSGAYTNFEKDAAGYGIAQWTYWTRKRGLLTYAKSVDSSIGNLTTQLEYLFIELSGSYAGVLKALTLATSVREASDVVLTKFERPAVQTETVKEARAKFGQQYFDRFASERRG